MLIKSMYKKIFCAMLTLGLVVFSYNVIAQTPDCPDCPPEYDGSIFPGGSCKNCRDNNDLDGSIFPGGSCTNCSNKSDKKVRIVDGTRKRCPNCPVPEFRTKNYQFTAPRYKKSNRRECCDMASFALTHVDFRLNEKEEFNPYASHVGNYRFRIFGCRRESKKALLNHGRLIQKNMMFSEVFKKAADKCYKVMDFPNVCLEDKSVRLPEYVLTAEIKDLFMNVCDEYNWKQSKKANKREGSAEITVAWRLMNLSQTKVFWKGVTTGYADVENGVYEGEIKLTEEAFADAVARLSSLPDFENQLKRRPSTAKMEKERAYLIAYDRKVNPGKCQIAPQYMPQPTCPGYNTCPCAVQQPCFCNQPTCSCPQVACPCAVQQGKPKVEEFVDIKTKKKIIEKKIITTTRVETPTPVCRQVCQPVCPQCPLQCNQECTQPKCRKICKKVCEEGGKCTETCWDDCGDKPKTKGGVVVEHKTVVPQVEEKGGVKETHRVYENCIDDEGNVITDGSCTTESWVELDGYKVDNKLCIVDRPPYNELSPENMLKIRSSIVEIENAKGQKGIGLVISDSFVLTSASLVNKIQNQYDVKAINGDVVKAKAVRVNPSKNTALMHLEKPVTFTPLSLNLALPPVDQEGYISLGLVGTEDTAKNYMDDSGKIYGYRYSDALGTEIIVDTLVQKVSVGSVLIDKLGTINGMSNSAKQTKEGMDLFIPTESVLRSVGLSICEKLYEKEVPVSKPITEQVISVEQKAPEAMPEAKRK